MCARGATTEDLAALFDTTRRTIERWAVQHEEFCRAVRVGKEAADDRTERSLYSRANGYEYEAEKIMVVDGVIQRVTVLEHVPPDPRSLNYWLNNRRPKEWRNQVTVDATVKSDGASSLGQILSRIEQIEALLQGATTINAQVVEVLPVPVNDAD